MKFKLHHRFLRPDASLEEKARQKLSKLEAIADIEAAEVTLERHPGASPPFSARVHLVIPGPDLHAEGKDHTPAATLNKALEGVTRQLRQRKHKLQLRRRHDGDEVRVARRPGGFPVMAGA